jgi:type II secretion system protein L
MALSSPKQYGLIHVTHLTPDSLDFADVTGAPVQLPEQVTEQLKWQCAWVIVKAGQITGQGLGSLQQATQALGKVPYAVALPTSQLVVTKLSLPTKNDNQRRTAIPFALQSQLACNANELSWSWLSQGHQLQLIGIAKSKLKVIQQAIEENQLAPKWIIADALYLGASDSLWKLLITPNYWLLHYGDHLACRVELNQKNSTDDAVVWLQKAYHEAQKNASGVPFSIDVTGLMPSQLEQFFSDNNVTFANIPPLNTMANSAVLLAPQFDAKRCLNLLPKSQKKNRVPKINWHLWRLPYVLVVALSLVGLGHLWLTNQNLAQQLEHSIKQGQYLFRQALPNERLIDPQSQLESLLLQAQVPKQKAQLLPLLYEFKLTREPLSETEPAPTFKRLTLADGKLQVDLANPLDKAK